LTLCLKKYHAETSGDFRANFENMEDSVPHSAYLRITTTGGAPAAIDRSPSSMSFTGVQGGANPASQTLSVANSGGGTLSWSVSDNAGWLSVSPTSGTCTTETDSVTVSTDTTGLAAGTYNGTITISAAGATNSPQSTAVSLTVTSSGGGGGGSGVATVPFFDGFETGDLQDYWSTYSSSSAGRIRVTGSYGPHTGSYHVTLDRYPSGASTLNELVLTIDLAGLTGVSLDFWFREFSDETHSMPASFTGHSYSDGVAISANGTTWYRLQTLSGGTYASRSFDLDAAIAAAGISYTPTFKIKFQQYDNYPITTDGFAFDDIAVDAAAVVTLSPPTMNPEPDFTAGTSNTVSWTDIDPGATDSQVQCATDAGFGSIVADSGPLAVPTDSYTFTGLADGTIYYYRARVIGSGGTSSSSWSQTTQAEFDSDTRSNVSTTESPGDVTLAPATGSGGEITGRIQNPSFEAPASLSIPSWPLIHSASGLNGYATYSPFLNMPTHGTQFAETYAAWGDYQPAGSYEAWAQSVSLTGIDSITFDVQLSSPGTWLNKVRGQFLIDGSVRWERSSAGTYTGQSVNVSSLSGTHQLEIRILVVSSFTAPFPSAQWVSWDNFRTYGAGVLGYVPSGSITSTPIAPSSLDRWGTLTYAADSSAAGTALTVDVLSGTGSLLLAGVASGTDLDAAGVTASSIKLRANLSTSVNLNTPKLSDWKVTYSEAGGGTGQSDWSNVVSSTQDASPPSITPPPNGAEEQTDLDGTPVDLGEPTVTDNLDPDPTVTNDAPGVFPLGETVVTWTAVDHVGNTATAEQTVTVVDTTAPVVTIDEVAPVVEQESSVGTQITIVGHGADVCDADLDYSWTDNGTPIEWVPPPGGGPTLTIEFQLGNHIVTLYAEDDSGNIGSATVEFSVVDTTPPSIAAPPDVTKEQADRNGTVVTAQELGQPKVSDACDADLDVENDAPATFPLGATVVTWTVTDDSGNSASAQQTVTIVDTTAPSGVFDVLKDVLQPPNHRMHLCVTLSDVSDICDADPEVEIVVTSNEEINGPGDGNAEADWEVKQNGDVWEVWLRAERSGGGDGRTYTVTMTVTDDSGNAATATATVVVPHDNGNKGGK